MPLTIRSTLTPAQEASDSLSIRRLSVRELIFMIMRPEGPFFISSSISFKRVSLMLPGAASRQL